MKRLYFTVTNDLNYDQRMIRICSSLAAAGYSVTLVGRKKKDSLPLKERPFAQKRLSLLFDKGKLFYIEYNIRLFFWLLFRRMDVLCAIDLDTILPCLCLSRLRRITRVYDAHELFTEMKEVVSRPGIYRFWKWVERKAVPKFPVGYTVNEPIRDIFREQYGVQYEVIRNLPRVQTEYAAHPEPFILYQGAVNEGRSFETLIPAFQWIGVPFHIYGDGNYLEECRALIHRYGLQDKVFLKGKVLPEELRKITLRALIGLTLFENKGLSNYYSLANRFFDYIQAGIPQVCVDYPVYRSINEQFGVALLVEDLSPESLAAAINRLAHDAGLQEQLRRNCLAARTELNWEREEQRLLQFYQKLSPA